MAPERDTIAVIICSYDLKRRELLKNAINSMLVQTYPPDEIIIVISSSLALRDAISADFPNLKIVFSQTPLSATQARNRGIPIATSEILAFTDDDILADKGWIGNLLEIYSDREVLAVGGKIIPIWLTGEPDYLPEELYWLVGAIHESYLPEKLVQTRNVYGPNMSFRKAVFQEVGLFEESLGFGKGGASYIQGEEPEFGLRMIKKLGKGTIYNPAAIIYHLVPAAKLKLNILFKRSFYQGYTKALMDHYSKSAASLNPEKDYLKRILGIYLPARIKGLFWGKAKRSQLKKLVVLLVSVVCVGAGFATGKILKIRA